MFFSWDIDAPGKVFPHSSPILMVGQSSLLKPTWHAKRPTNVSNGVKTGEFRAKQMFSVVPENGHLIHPPSFRN